MRTSLHIAGKDIRIWSRDIAALGVLLGMPLVLIFILGSALGGQGQDMRIKVAVENQDDGVIEGVAGSPLSSGGTKVNIGDELVDTLKKSKRLNDAFDIDFAARGVEERRAQVAAGKLSAVLVIPPEFSSKVRAGIPVDLDVFADPGAQLSSGIWEGVVRSFAADYSAASISVQTSMDAAKRENPALLMRPETVGRLEQAAVQGATREDKPVVVTDAEAQVVKTPTALSYYAVSMTAMFLMFGSMFGAFSTIRERREKTLERLFAAPVNGMTVTAGKMLGIFVLGMLQFVVLYLATRFMFRVEWGNDLAATFAIAAAEMLAVTGLAVLIAALAKTERGAGGIGPLVIQVQALLGGAFFTITILPEWLQPIRYASVIGWAIEGWKKVQFEGAGLLDVTVPVAALLGFAAAFFIVGSVLTGARR